MIFDPNYKEIDIKGYEGLYKITNIETEEIIIANSKREAANIINGTDAGIIYAIKNNSIYKHKYKIKVLSYGCK